MKATAGQIGAAIDEARARGAGGPRLFLLHGPDEAGALDYAARLSRAMGEGAERIDLDGAALRAQPGRLADEAAAISLFADARFIRVTAMGEESVEAVELLLAAPSAGNPVIGIAPSAKATGKLVKLAVAAPTAMALACYPPDGQNAVRMTIGIAREHGVRLTNSAAAAMFEAAGNDRAVLTREIEKLSLFLDAAVDRPREASEDVLAEIGANISEAEMSVAIAAVVAGEPRSLAAELEALDTAGMTIPLLRSLSKRLIALADMRGDMDRGDTPESVVEKHRVFWKEKASTVAALRHWSPPAIANALARTRRAERALLSGGNPATVAAQHDILGIARALERRR